MDKPICQSCGMPMTPEDFGTNKDASANEEYCKYCFKDGAFTSDETLEEMIESCVKFMAEPGSEFTEEQARQYLQESMPKLKRWQQ